MNITTLTKEDGLIARTLKIEDNWSGTFLRVTDTQSGRDISTVLGGAKDKLIEALLGENATVITDLPEVSQRGHNKGYVGAGDYTRSITNTPEEVLKNAKALLAIHAFLVKHNAEQEEAKKAEAEAVKAKEAARDKRRDEICDEEFAVSYNGLGATSKRFVDRIIKLEEAAKAPAWT